MKTQGNLQAVMKNIKGDNWEKKKCDQTTAVTKGDNSKLFLQ